MQEAYKEYAGDSGPNWILDLDGPDGNVYCLWGILEQFWEMFGWEGDPVEESKSGGHYEGGGAPYEGYEGVLDYCLYFLSPSPAGVEFRMYGQEIQQVSDYRHALSNKPGSNYRLPYGEETPS